MPRGNCLSTNQKHYQDLGSAHHQYGISALVTQTSSCKVSSGNFTKCWLFSQAILYLVRWNITWHLDLDQLVQQVAHSSSSQATVNSSQSEPTAENSGQYSDGKYTYLFQLSNTDLNWTLNVNTYYLHIITACPSRACFMYMLYTLITPPSGRGLVIPIFFPCFVFCFFFGGHLPQTSAFRLAKEILVVSFATQPRAFILSDGNTFYTPRGGWRTTAGSNAPGAFLVLSSQARKRYDKSPTFTWP